MALDFSNQLFGGYNPLTGDQESFVTTEEEGGLLLVYAPGNGRDLTLSALAIFGRLKTEVQRIKGYKFTVKLFNNEGTSVAFTYKIFVAGVMTIPPNLPPIDIVLDDNAAYTKSWFIGTENAKPGDLIQLSMGGDILGTAAGATENTTFEFRVETIMERKRDIL